MYKNIVSVFCILLLAHIEKGWASAFMRSPKPRNFCNIW
jgi:hypothetical protein